MMFSKISYVTIFVKNFDETLHFYTDILGLRILQGKDGFAMLDTHPVRINIHGGSPENPSDTTEVSFSVSDLDKTYRYLTERGVKITRDPMTYPDGPSMFNFMDPEGNPLAAVQE